MNAQLACLEVRQAVKCHRSSETPLRMRLRLCLKSHALTVPVLLLALSHTGLSLSTLINYESLDSTSGNLT